MIWIVRCVSTRSGFAADGSQFHTATLTGKDPEVLITVSSRHSLPHHLDHEYVLELEQLGDEL